MITSIIKKVYDGFQNFRIHQKMMIIYIALLQIPVIIFLAFSYKYMVGYFEQNAMFSSQQSFEQSSRFMDSMFYNVKKIEQNLLLNPKLRTIIAKKSDDYTIPEQLTDRNFIRDLLISGEDEYSIYKVKLYVEDKFYYSGDKINIFSIKEAENAIWYEKLKNNNVSGLWCPPSYFADENQKVPTVAYIKNLLNPNNYREILGLLRIEIKEDNLIEMLKDSASINNSVVYMQSSEGDIISVTDKQKFNEMNIDNNFLKNLELNKSNWFYCYINNKKVIARKIKLRDNDWYMVSLIPYSEITGIGKNAFLRIFFLMCLLSLVASFFAYRVSVVIKHTSKSLIDRMREIQNGNLNKIVEISSKDEIGELINNYNFMVTEISTMFEQKYEMGIAVKSAELRALQSQINPHFLYNTLDLMQCLAISNDSETLVKIISYLSKYYKLSLNNGSEIVTLREEILHIEEYMKIQSIRFDLSIKMEYDIADVMYTCLLPKITLQPLVENSILHGIRPKSDNMGIIKISACRQEEVITITIQDNGIGMSQDKLVTILEKKKGDDEKGNYALWNINERLKLLYGTSFGLSFESIPYKETRAIIRIPAKNIPLPSSKGSVVDAVGLQGTFSEKVLRKNKLFQKNVIPDSRQK